MLRKAWAGRDIFDKGEKMEMRAGHQDWLREKRHLSLILGKRKRKCQGSDDLIKKQFIMPCACKVALLMEMQTGKIKPENSLAVPFKYTHIPCDPAVPLLEIYPGEMKTRSHKTLHEYRSFIHNYPELETTHMTFNG